MKMHNRKLHIIAFDVPFPPDYGGIADLYYKLKSLHAAGASICYHCYYYKGHHPPTAVLEQYCDELYYYERKKSGLKLLFSRLPYIVASRCDATLLNRIRRHPAPVLIEGIQSAYGLVRGAFPEVKVIFRANNVEHRYYEGLARWERNLLKKSYLKWEAVKLRRFERQLEKVDAILSVAKMDIPHFERYAPTLHVPPFFNDEEGGNEEGGKDPFPSKEKGQKAERFVLFQGNLSVKENEHAAVYLLQQVAPQTHHPIVIAGRHPSARLKRLARKNARVSLVESPSDQQMNALIHRAHIHLLLSFQQTGIKLKLLHALQAGRHVIINSFMDDSGIFSELCEVADEAVAIVSKVEELMQVDFTAAMKAARDKKFRCHYHNPTNAQRILNLL